MTAPAEGGRGGTPPRPPAAAHGPRQWFIFGPWAFDVTAAIGLLRAAPRPARPLPVRQWARAYGLDPAPAAPRTASLVGPGPDFDPVYAMTTDLDEPVIIATITVSEGQPPSALLIDGCHRLYKAARLGRDELPSLVLTADETAAIRHDGVLGPARAPARPQRNRKEGES
jgi:hypothetical protein